MANINEKYYPVSFFLAARVYFFMEHRFMMASKFKAINFQPISSNDLKAYTLLVVNSRDVTSRDAAIQVQDRSTNIKIDHRTTSEPISQDRTVLTNFTRSDSLKQFHKIGQSEQGFH
ncbi:hypothetical protein CHS0354_035815 [Potamilus streckersoni]|uniref:Uncharacterized protein n=1 Tax=Potamilus streckersoni TaxID=2493646 RepID=A0AAE0SWY8_9BIVA|nr:hypothetical protein CHS0354_035815 [Potamilus streckersoni]